MTILLWSRNFYLPTKLCFLLSHKGAARTPLVTKAKKAFFTCSQESHNHKGKSQGQDCKEECLVCCWKCEANPMKGWSCYPWDETGWEVLNQRLLGSGKGKDDSTHLKGSIKYNQFGAGGNQVIAAMRLHEGSIYTIVGFWGLWMGLFHVTIPIKKEKSVPVSQIFKK